MTSSRLPYLADAYNRLLDHNLAVSVSVWRDDAKIFGAATGLTPGWQLVTTDTPMVLASVSKLITALSIARLTQAGLVNLDQPVDWDALGVAHHPTWNDVTVRELLAHTSGMPILRRSWFDTPGACTVPLTEAMSSPPRHHRGRWTYSNGNYCALGLLVEHITGHRLDDAARALIFDPLGISGPHLTIEPQPNSDGPYRLGLARLQRLGGAGTWMGSTDDIAVMLGAVTALDRETLISPGIITDQYGWGHTGTIDGAKACAWIMENGRTVVTALVSGSSPATGGAVCDIILPALAIDLGVWADRPIREP